MNEPHIRAWAESHGLTLDIKNHGEHWIFKGIDHGLLAEYWPSTGRLVFGRHYKHATRARNAEALFRLIGNHLPRSRYEDRIVPAYVERLRQLVEV